MLASAAPIVLERFAYYDFPRCNMNGYATESGFHLPRVFRPKGSGSFANFISRD